LVLKEDEIQFSKQMKLKMKLKEQDKPSSKWS